MLVCVWVCVEENETIACVCVGGGGSAVHVKNGVMGGCIGRGGALSAMRMRVRPVSRHACRFAPFPCCSLATLF